MVFRARTNIGSLRTAWEPPGENKVTFVLKEKIMDLEYVVFKPNYTFLLIDPDLFYLTKIHKGKRKR